ncbi:MAG TPA: hypothetical protein VN690_05235, partial [Terriglobales bacterium]|nr:hypothetical protein [Terriglobales bacterium]
MTIFATTAKMIENGQKVMRTDGYRITTGSHDGREWARMMPLHLLMPESMADDPDSYTAKEIGVWADTKDLLLARLRELDAREIGR